MLFSGELSKSSSRWQIVYIYIYSLRLDEQLPSTYKHWQEYLAEHPLRITFRIDNDWRESRLLLLCRPDCGVKFFDEDGGEFLNSLKKNY